MASLRGFVVEFRAGTQLQSSFQQAVVVQVPQLLELRARRRGRKVIAQRSHEAAESEWTVQDSDSLYRLHGWGAPYFAINTAGHLCVRPSGGSTQGTASSGFRV